MARVAVIIGVSNYSTQPALPACANDARLMQLAREAAGDYDDVLFIAATFTASV